jgi:hypothetical protein
MKQLRALLTALEGKGPRVVGLAILLTLAANSVAVQAQTNFGQISGTVSDAAGAVVPGAAVTAIDSATNLSRTMTTDRNGYYVITNLLVGTYRVTVEVANFKKAIRTENELSADERMTIDFILETGQISEIVEIVSESGETVNTTSGEVGKVIDSQQVENLALNGRNYTQLMTLIPGAVITQEDALDTSLATGNLSINGNRGNQNNLTVDGGNNLNAGSNNSQINNVGVDFIDEVKIQTSNFSAEYGRNSGAQINVTTKRGTNRIKGSVFEFLRNDALDARSFFAPERPFLRYHNYGYSIGGPLPYFNFGENDGPLFKSGKDKLFFFWGQEWKSIHRQANVSNRGLPALAELNGDFRFRLRGRDGIVGTADDGVLRDPSRTGSCTAPVVNSSGVVTTPANRTACFGGSDPTAWNVIPTSRITTDGRAFSDVYRRMIELASSYNGTPGGGNGGVGNNTTFQPFAPADFRQELLRIDFVANAQHTIYGRWANDTNNNLDPYGTFITSNLPTIQSARSRPGYGLQFGHLFNITPSLINDAKLNFSGSHQRVPPANDLWKRETYGFTFTQLFPNGGEYENSIPDTTVNSGFPNFRGAPRSLTALADDMTFSDTLTWIRGDHTLKFGTWLNFGGVDQNGRTEYAGLVTFNTNRRNAAGQANLGSTGVTFADTLLGNFRTYQEYEYDPLGKFRYEQFDAFVNDSWRVNGRLSLELGLRWQYALPWYLEGNNLANFDPALYDPSRAVVVNSNGTVTIPSGANRFNGLIRPGEGIPEDARLYVPNWDSPIVNAVPDGAPRGFYDAEHIFMPRIGFAYAPFSNSRTAIRGGFGVYADRTQGNMLFELIKNPPFVDSIILENGSIADIASASAAALTPFAEIGSIDPNFKTPKTMSFSLGVQHELPGGIFVEANAVGNLGRHLTRYPDINQVPFGTGLSNTVANRPFKGYATILQRKSDATSNYYAGQFYAAKRKGQVTATISYTWSKALTDASGFNDDPEDWEDRHYSYGPATFDRRHVIVATYTLAPRFRGANAFVKTLLDGFEISGITRYQSGRFFTITGNSSDRGERRADYVGGEIYLKDDRQWVNPDAFAVAPSGVRGNSGVGIIEGPSLMVWDLSVRRRIRFNERMNLRLQADLFNVFNRANFSTFQGNLSSGNFGMLTASGPGRSIQLGIRFGF